MGPSFCLFTRAGCTFDVHLSPFVWCQTHLTPHLRSETDLCGAVLLMDEHMKWLGDREQVKKIYQVITKLFRGCNVWSLKKTNKNGLAKKMNPESLDPIPNKQIFLCCFRVSLWAVMKQTKGCLSCCQFFVHLFKALTAHGHVLHINSCQVYG